MIIMIFHFTFNVWWSAGDVGEDVDQDEEEGHQ